MADKVTPAFKAVPRADGLKLGSANMTVNTPNPSFGRYFSHGREGDKAVDSQSIFGKDNRDTAL